VSNLALISSSGPGTASFSEFNPLFTANGYTAQFTAMGGENSTWAGDAVVAGLMGQAAFSVGWSGFKTDGFRVNGDQKDQLFDAFVQYDFSPQSSVQAEYRYRKTEIGDVVLRFFEDSFSPGERNNTETNTARVGFRHTFSPGSIFLASVIYQDQKATVSDNQQEFPVASFTLSAPAKR
jgi:predicted porin